MTPSDPYKMVRTTVNGREVLMDPAVFDRLEKRRRDLQVEVGVVGSLTSGGGKERTMGEMNRRKLKWFVRVRPDDKSPWGEPTMYESKRKANTAGAFCRAILGQRTHTYQAPEPDIVVDEVRER